MLSRSKLLDTSMGRGSSLGLPALQDRTRCTKTESSTYPSEAGLGFGQIQVLQDELIRGYTAVCRLSSRRLQVGRGRGSRSAGLCCLSLRCLHRHIMFPQPQHRPQTQFAHKSLSKVSPHCAHLHELGWLCATGTAHAKGRHVATIAHHRHLVLPWKHSNHA